MRRFRADRLFYVLLLFCVAAFPPLKEVRAEEAKKIDLSSTAQYVASWAARTAFPDSPSFAHQNAYSQLALEGRVPDADKDKIVEFLMKCQRPDGGFVTNPDLRESPNVIFTCFALAALDLIDAPSKIDREKAVGFILSLVQETGGIKATQADSAPTLGTTYYGIRSLYLLKALDRLDRNRTIAFIKSHQDDAKGFGVLVGKPSAPQPTFMAIYSLKLLDRAYG